MKPGTVHNTAAARVTVPAALVELQVLYVVWALDRALPQELYVGKQVAELVCDCRRLLAVRASRLSDDGNAVLDRVHAR
ncbi:MAG TPA: hypothetical protein VGL39_28050 [Jatrophihabitantaceae bacterium]|jgi:hypothetical protein